jgi:dihydrofolate synthase/folylpolyglutamate synthase
VVNYEESVHYLYSLGNEVQTAKLGLERIAKLMQALGDPQGGPRFIHIAGTNGKGSTAAMIESGLRAAGQRTGLYTSPHLVEPTERIRIAGEPVTHQQFAGAFTTVHDTAERMLQSAELDLHPTYFESVTAMAFLLFQRAQLDWVVLEVGLGGRLDATNIVAPQLCVITPIDYDHQVFLGDSITSIANEKAGILKPGVPAVFAPQHAAAAEVLKRNAGGTFLFSNDWPTEDLSIDIRGSRFRVGNLNVVCPLAGEHQVENARTAAIALHELGYPCDGIAETRWPGRLERVSEHPEIILDGAHNVAGTQALANYIRRFYSGRNIWLVYGVMRDKAVDQMTSLLFPLAGRIILTAPDNSRAMPPERIPAADALVTHSVGEAIEALRQAGPEDAVFITGSLFVVGEARRYLVQ